MACYGLFPLNVNNAAFAPIHFNQLRAKYTIISQRNEHLHISHHISPAGRNCFKNGSVAGCPTRFKVGLHEGQEGVAGCQVTDTDAHEVLAHLGLSEQVVDLVRKMRRRDE